MEVIQSLTNPKVKLWYQLRSKKGREQQEKYIIEGYKLIEEAILSVQKIESIIVEEERGIPNNLQLLLNEYNNNIIIFAVSKSIIGKLAETETPQGVFAVVEKRKWTIDRIIAKGASFLLLIDEIQDPGNLGTIIRSADASGVEAIIVGNGTVEHLNPKVIRSAMGSIFHIPIIEANLDYAIPKLQENDIRVIGTSPYASKSYFDVDLQEKVAILMGNESKGLSEQRMKQVNQMIKIPLLGQAESLNVAMAATIILYERVRQKADKV